MAMTTKDELWNSGCDEIVETNQRALIDKVLARYSGEFTVFRELLQNSDDASSKGVEIRFETKKYIDRSHSNENRAPHLVNERLPELKSALVHRWKFKNNGILFRDEDWNRLKKIAEGDPDEEKIGASGVGFYSLFSITDEPFITSGGRWLGFYWRDGRDWLFVRRGELPHETNDPWTTFEMDLREPTPIPAVFDFTRFLVSSITFMAHLREVSVYFDDKRLVHLTKDAGIPKQLVIPRSLRPTSTMGFMNIKGLKSAPLHITADIMKWIYNAETEKPKPPPAVEPMAGFFSLFGFGGSTPQRSSIPLPPQPVIDESEYLKVDQSSVVLTIFTAEVDVKLNQKISAELHRSTKKNPPRALKYELIYTGKEEYDASKKEDALQPKATGSIFQGLRADLDGSGSARLFIGHATAQTTGLGGHMAARFIPTVERESIYLVDRNAAVWNRELLFVGGFLARAAYELEMQDMGARWRASLASSKPGEPLDPEVRKWFYDKAKHNLQFFTFHPSTPSAVVSRELQSAFFDCDSQGQAFPVVSSAGVKSALDVRMPDPTFSGFLRDLPVFPEELLSSSKSLVAALRSRGMLRDITFADVLKELRGRPLSEVEMVACLQWWINTSQQDPKGINDIRRELLGAATLSVGSSDDEDERIIPLAEIQTFLNPRNAAIPTDGPLPTHLLPASISGKFDLIQLQQSLHWRELSILEWVQHVVDPAVYTKKIHFSIVESPDWADRVLQILGRYWGTLSKVNQIYTIGLLGNLTCIPTSAGMKPPDQAYFSSADIFRDLPIVTLPSGVHIRGNLENVLADLGVRKHVDLQVVLSRIIKTDDWTIPDLVKYLVSVQSRLQTIEIERLRLAPAFPEEGSAEQFRNEKSEDGTPKNVPKFRASELYEPLEVFRSVGLPIIDWRGKDCGNKWRSNSEEAKFLFNLGLQRYPSTEVILRIAAKDEPRRTVALNYFLDNYMQKYTDYTADAHANIAFVPAIHKGEKKLAKPLDVFSNPDWQSLGFPVLDPALRQDAANKLKIKEHPPANQLVRLLEASPPTTQVQFVNSASGSHLKKARDHEIQVSNEFELDCKRVVLIDTPGMQSSTSPQGRRDEDVTRSIKKLLAKSYPTGTKLAGIIFVHKIIRNVEVSHWEWWLLGTMECLEDFCEDVTLKNLIIMTHDWEELSPADEERLKQDFSGGRKYVIAMAAGAQVHHCTNAFELDLGTLRIILGGRPVVPNVQQEPINKGSESEQTAVAAELSKEILELAERHSSDIKKLAESMQKAMEKNVEELRRELEEQNRRAREEADGLRKRIAEMQSEDRHTSACLPLDRSSPQFTNLLNDTLHGQEYERCVQNFQAGDVVWFVDYLDKALDSLDPSGPASRKCLRELGSICATHSTLPTSYTIPPHLLTVDSYAFASGGFGDMYRGTFNGLPVCVKRLRVATPEDIALFCKEAVMWKSLKHPNILPLLGATISPSQLVSALMPAGDLSKYLPKNPETNRIELLSEIAEGLRYLHSRNVIHGDLKGMNILVEVVDDIPHARIADFGIAIVTKNLDSIRPPTRQEAHTPRWSAPEILREQNPSKESDIYSFAMVMIEVLTGEVPFSGEKTNWMVLQAVLRGDRPSRPVHPSCTDGLWALTQRCWDQDPGSRPDILEVWQSFSYISTN